MARTADGQKVLGFLNEREALHVRPALLLAPLMATMPLYAPDTRLFALLAPREVERGGVFVLTMAVACALVGLVLAVRALRERRWPSLRWLEPAGGVAYVAGLAAFAAGLVDPGLPEVLLAAGGALAGAGLVAEAVAWARCFDGGVRNVMLHGALVCVVSALLTWGTAQLDGVVLLVALGVQVVVGAFAPFFLRRPLATGRPVAGPGADGPADSKGFSAAALDLVSILWVPLLGFFVLVFITTSFEFPAEASPVSTEATGSLIGAALALAVCLVRLDAPFVLTVDKLVIPGCAAVCLVLGSFPVGSPLFHLGAATVFAPLVFMTLYALASLVAVARAGEFPTAFAVGLTLCAACAVSIFAGLMSRSLGPDANLGELSWVVIVAYFAVVFAALGYTSWRREREPEGLAEAAPAGPESSHDELLDRRVTELAEEHALSERETQVLGYLARGYSSTYIASALYISANTVRSHIYNMYRKLDVANRGELLELVNRE